MVTALPINAILADLRETLNAADQAILEAPPGAGKTTGVPLALLNESWLASQKIIVLQPRRVAARTAAERMAQTLGETLGKTVGYRVRNDSKVSMETRIEVVTEGILTRQLQRDPSLENVGLLIFDEFHERNLDSDLALALCLQARALFREQPLKIILMSATLGSEAFQSRLRAYLDKAALIRSEGRSFPVDLHYHANKRGEPQIVLDSQLHWLYPRIASRVIEALEQSSGNILVFLPGRKEINRCLQNLRSLALQGIDILCLHASISLDEQRRVVLGQYPKRCIILATDIAETSLTIQGVTVVVDSGLVRISEFDANTATSRLRTRRISKASSVQRAGRAGRLAPGTCYRLWSESEQEGLIEQRGAEILQADLAPLALQLLHWGAGKPSELDWLDAPPEGHYQQAMALLKDFGAAEEKENTWLISEHGKRMATLPLHPRLAHMLIMAASIGATRQAANLAALVSERDAPSQRETDASARLDILEGHSACPPADNAWLRGTKKQSERFCQLNAGLASKSSASVSYGYLAALAFPDRIALPAGPPGSFKLSNGRSARLNEDDALFSAECLVVLDLGGEAGRRDDRIYSALALDPKLFDTELAHLLCRHSKAYWDEKSGRYIAQQEDKIGKLVLRSLPSDTVDEDVKQRSLVEFIAHKGLTFLPWDDSTRNFQARVALAKQYDQETTEPWPALDGLSLLRNIDSWLGLYLKPIKHLNDLAKLPLLTILQSQLSWTQLQRLDAFLPNSVEVPSGSRKHIDYLQTPPVLAVKLQEMFGLENSPKVANGKLALSIHLLSPARRPLQITQDLAAFWRNGYQDVKKEMRGRYPKHPWPDDPLNAPATAFTKHRKPKT